MQRSRYTRPDFGKMANIQLSSHLTRPGNLACSGAALSSDHTTCACCVSSSVLHKHYTMFWDPWGRLSRRASAVHGTVCMLVLESQHSRIVLHVTFAFGLAHHCLLKMPEDLHGHVAIDFLYLKPPATTAFIAGSTATAGRWKLYLQATHTRTLTAGSTATAEQQLVWHDVALNACTSSSCSPQQLCLV